MILRELCCDAAMEMLVQIPFLRRHHYCCILILPTFQSWLSSFIHLVKTTEEIQQNSEPWEVYHFVSLAGISFILDVKKPKLYCFFPLAIMCLTGLKLTRKCEEQSIRRRIHCLLLNVLEIECTPLFVELMECNRDWV